MSEHTLDGGHDHGREGADLLGDTFTRARKALNLTKGGLARRLGVDESLIRRWEADGYASATIGQVQQVAVQLGLKLKVTVAGDGA